MRTVAPHFGYQLHFASGDVEKAVRSKTEIRQFLTALYGGKTEKGEFGFDVKKGILIDKLPGLRPSRLLSEEVSAVNTAFEDVCHRDPCSCCCVQEMEYYTTEFARNGIHGPRM